MFWQKEGSLVGVRPSVMIRLKMRLRWTKQSVVLLYAMDGTRTKEHKRGPGRKLILDDWRRCPAPFFLYR